MWRAGVAEGLKILEPQVPDGEISRARGSEVVGSVLAFWYASCRIRVFQPKASPGHPGGNGYLALALCKWRQRNG